MKVESKKQIIGSLKNVILNLHNCKSKGVESIPIKEEFEGETVWEGVVQVFNLIDHPVAPKCYAWSYLVDNKGKKKFVVALHQDPVNSPEDAVKAFIDSK
jgi:hypothetical protein